MSKVIIEFSFPENIPETTEYMSLIQAACETALEFEGFEGNAEISVTVTNNAEIKELNFAHRGIDKATDVLSFPLGENGVYDKNLASEAYMLGDIVISLERAAEQAKEYGHSLRREITFLTVHSVLHLLGYDHVNSEQEEREMFKKQDSILNKMGVTREQ